MPRNNADFQAGLFHGTNFEFNPGDIVSPQPLSKDNDEGYGWAFATHDIDYAREHGNNVYLVERPDDAEQHPDNDDAVVSKKGFRVIKKVD